MVGEKIMEDSETKQINKQFNTQKTNRMKKIFATLTVLAMFSFGSVAVMAQDAAEAAPVAEEVTVDSAAVEAPVVEAEEDRKSVV